MKKAFAWMMSVILACGLLAGCSAPAAEEEPTKAPVQTDEQAPAAAAAPTQEGEKDPVAGTEIMVVSREEGSGTRGAFVELMGIEVKNEDGTKEDRTTEEAVIASKTDVVLQQVAGNVSAIGYISMGSLNDTVKALKIGGVEATAENVKNGTYAVSRPFNVAYKSTLSDVAQDFMNFIMSAEGQQIASGSYIPVDENAAAFTSNGASGKVVVAGSSSVTPLMEKLAEAYKAVNAGAEVEVQQSDSSAGMQAAIDGVCDIGMASRELKESEAAELTAAAIALDGIAVIVNNENPAGDMTAEEVASIFMGERTEW